MYVLIHRVFGQTMGCPQSKSKKNIAVEENGGDHGNKVRKDVVRAASEETAAPRKTIEGHKDADDLFTRGRVSLNLFCLSFFSLICHVFSLLDMIAKLFQEPLNKTLSLGSLLF